MSLLCNTRGLARAGCGGVGSHRLRAKEVALRGGGLLMVRTSNNFTVARLLLALLVVFSHSYPLGGWPEPVVLGRTPGGLAVQSFFAISGYLIVGSYISTAQPVLFAWKRFCRLAPALFVVVPFSLQLFHWQNQYAGNPMGEIANGALWTLSWEGLMYIITLLLGVTGLLTAPVLGGVCLAGLVVLFTDLKGLSTSAYVIAPFFVAFAIGGLIRLNEGQLHLRGCGIFASAALILAYLPVTKGAFDALQGPMMFHYGPSIPWERLQWFMSLVAIPFVVLFICRAFPVSLQIEQDYSYGVYIFGWPIQQTLVHQAIEARFPLEPSALFFSSALLSLACAAISWHLVEKNGLWLGQRVAKFRFSKPVSLSPPDVDLATAHWDRESVRRRKAL